jgi:succinate dehydrogenase / fumarate reductase, flavoprotein subunit
MANVTKRKFDVVIVGAGGSGMRASLQLSRAGLNVARIPWLLKVASAHRWAI